ncbi:MAG TPA: hypothetical protein VHK89_01400 [Actinomycetota bacterium]|nr:hypothetical protein [Actinomycetota bacterium]
MTEAARPSRGDHVAPAIAAALAAHNVVVNLLVPRRAYVVFNLAAAGALVARARAGALSGAEMGLGAARASP